jgi:RNA polymerase sigma factor (sigma-70 family)
MSNETRDFELDFGEITQGHPRGVYRLVRRFVDDPEEALDLTQEVFLRAFLHRDEFRSESAFKTWLYRIAINLCQDERRRRARRQAREVLTPEVLETDSGEAPALEGLIARERSERLEELLQALPPDEYVAIVLHYHGGLPQRQVAEVVNASVSAVESRLRRARARLARWADEEREVVPARNTDGQRFLTVGRVLLGLRDHQAAVTYCEKAARLMPDDTTALCALGTAYWQLRNLDGAWEMAQRALRVDGNCGEAHNLCGIVHGTRGDREDAIAAFRRAADDDRSPARARAHGNLGVTYAFMGRWDEAVAELEQAIALDPNYGMAYSHLGNIYLRRKRYEEALRCQDRATALDPPFFQGHFNRGAALEAMGRMDEAVESYRRASELAPWWIDAHGAMGLVLHAQGRHEEAEAQFGTVLSLSGGAAYGSYFKGRAFLARGDEVNALAHFEQAAREGQDWAEPLLWLSQLHEGRGDLAAATRAVREALEREPDSEEAIERLRALAQRER